MVNQIDLNGDMGESFGIYQLGEEQDLLASLTSANIACGFHAGDPHVMKQTVQRCQALGVRIGAHPGLPDLQGFGRRMISISPDEAYELVVYQIGALQAFVAAEGGIMQHVKPHGALYHLAAADPAISEAIASAVQRVNAELIVYGPSGSALIAAAEQCGLRIAREAFADRRYTPDGTLQSRAEPGAVLHDADEAAEQALSIALHSQVTASDGSVLSLQADTLCLHGDGPQASLLAQKIRSRLQEAGIALRAFI